MVPVARALLAARAGGAGSGATGFAPVDSVSPARHLHQRHIRAGSRPALPACPPAWPPGSRLKTFAQSKTQKQKGRLLFSCASACLPSTPLKVAGQWSRLDRGCLSRSVANRGVATRRFGAAIRSVAAAAETAAVRSLRRD